VFTGGVGERSATVRELAVEGLGFLGLAIERRRNREMTADCDLSAESASAATIALAAREDLEITRQVRVVLGQADSGPERRQ
jgi:acetate kinase